jgi:SAM-dependent methyltransferase
VVGIERDVRAAAASRAYGVPVFVGDLDAVRGAAADLVLLFQTLEHFAEPDAVLRRCAEICRPGARLIVAVPNFNSWQARLFAGAWFHLDAPRHLTHFSRHSLTYLLRRVGFEPEHVRFVSWEHDPFGWIQSTLNILRFPKNLLTRSLIQWDWLAFANPRGVAMLVTTCILVIPALVLAPLSWLTGAGAIIEIRAVRR